jgi:hypothetical protein
MKRNAFSISISGLLLAAFAIGILAPAAEAKGKGSRRYKEYRTSKVHCGPTRVVEVHRSSTAGPLLAGLIGGLVLGTVIAHAAEPEPSYRPEPEPYYRPEPEPYFRPEADDAYYYDDPYCDDHFTTLVSYRRHAYHRHPAVVRVIEIDSGRCVETYRYHRGAWVAWAEGEDD